MEGCRNGWTRPWGVKAGRGLQRRQELVSWTCGHHVPLAQHMQGGGVVQPRLLPARNPGVRAQSRERTQASGPSVCSPPDSACLPEQGESRGIQALML